VLSVRSYEKRKQAALEIEHLIKEANAGPNRQPEHISQLIQLLSKEYAVRYRTENTSMRTVHV
jgi:hypothetical protein